MPTENPDDRLNELVAGFSACLADIRLLELSEGSDHETYPPARVDVTHSVVDPQLRERLAAILRTADLTPRQAVPALGEVRVSIESPPRAIGLDDDSHPVWSDPAEGWAELLPGWLRVEGWPYHARLADPGALDEWLAEVGIARPWTDRALAAVRVVEDHLASGGGSRPESRHPDMAVVAQLWDSHWPGSKPVGHDLSTPKQTAGRGFTRFRSQSSSPIRKPSIARSCVATTCCSTICVRSPAPTSRYG